MQSQVIINFITKSIAGVAQNNPHHCYDLLEHTKKVVEYLKSQHASQDLILAGWLHDVGKVAVKRYDPEKGYDVFHGHAKASLKWIEENYHEVSSNILAWVKYHDTTIESSKTLTRYIRKFGKDWVQDLLLLREADIMAQSGYRREDKLRNLSAARSWMG